MKRFAIMFVCLLTVSLSSLTQTAQTFDLATLQTSESFDIATFQSPKGWNKQATQDLAQFSTEDKTQGTYCVITLFKSLPGIGSAKENFDAAWQTVVKTVVNSTAAPQMFPSDNKADWQVVGGFAPFEKDGEKGVAVLYTASGYGKMVNALVLTNTQAYEAAITAFLESISFKKPAPEIQTQTPDNQNNSHPPLPGIFGSRAESAAGCWAIPVCLRPHFQKPITSSATVHINSLRKICS